MTPASQIIPKLLEALDLPNVWQLEQEIGATGRPIAQFISRGSPLSITVIHLILKRFPEVNPCYLLLGKGKPTLTQAMRKALGL